MSMIMPSQSTGTSRTSSGCSLIISLPPMSPLKWDSCAWYFRAKMRGWPLLPVIGGDGDALFAAAEGVNEAVDGGAIDIGLVAQDEHDRLRLAIDEFQPRGDGGAHPLSVERVYHHLDGLARYSLHYLFGFVAQHHDDLG